MTRSRLSLFVNVSCTESSDIVSGSPQIPRNKTVLSVVIAPVVRSANTKYTVSRAPRKPISALISEISESALAKVIDSWLMPSIASSADSCRVNRLCLRILAVKRLELKFIDVEHHRSMSPEEGGHSNKRKGVSALRSCLTVLMVVDIVSCSNSSQD